MPAIMYSSVIFIAFVVTLNAKSLNAIIKHRSDMHVFLLNKCLFFKRQTSMTNFTANFTWFSEHYDFFLFMFTFF
jgi:predicted GNAT superfamily acetyltransferase